MRGFLLDSHVAKSVAPALTQLRECYVIHLADWHAGAYLDADDSDIFEAAAIDDLVVVSHDVTTMPGVVSDLLRAGKPCAGVAFVVGPLLVKDVGALARALADLVDHPEYLPTGYPVVFLHSEQGRP